jgi:sulfur-oxidizing protein SoxX
MNDKNETVTVEARVNSEKNARFLGLLAATVIVCATASLGHADELVSYDIVDDLEIPKSLTGAPGDPDKGRDVFIDRKLGNCLGCHAVSELDTEQFHGEVGPPLDEVGDIYTEGELRLRVVNAKKFNPETIMPGFYVNDGLNRVAKDFEGKSILTAEQVEDVVAYLMTLKGS